MEGREPHTAEEIRDEVDRLLNTNALLRLTVPLPVAAERDHSKWGANWDMHFDRSIGHQIEIGIVLLQVKKRWDLKA